MKSIGVAGKGGTGKTTIAACIVRALVKRGLSPVLAIDADADANLGSILGIESESTIGELREDFRQNLQQMPPGMSKASYVEAGLHQIIAEDKDIDLITMGRGEGDGCYCYLNSLIQKFSDDLMGSYSWVVMDNEAGLEHISRRTSTHLNAMITVITENPLSIDSARSIAEIAKDIKNKVFKIYAVTNMVRDERMDRIKKEIEDIPIEFLCEIPFDPELEEYMYNGGDIKELESSLVLDSADTIIDKIGGKNGST